MADEKKIEFLKKLQTLAERGVGGEKLGAQRKLEELLKKYNIEEKDISDDKQEEFEFKFSTPFEKKLLYQLFYKIVPEYQSKVYKYIYGKGSRSICGIKCTKSEGLQIQIEYDFYRELWKEEEDFFFKCFIQKHGIFGKSSTEENKTKLTKEEIMRMQSMMQGMTDKTMHMMIEG